MLGFGPISSAPISGSSFSLIAIPAALVAAATITFGGSGRIGAITPIRANVSFAFAGAPVLYVNQAISGAASITFGGTPNLRVAGKPIIISAIPVSYTVRAMPGSYTLKAMSEQFTVRGVR